MLVLSPVYFEFPLGHAIGLPFVAIPFYEVIVETS